MVYMRKQERRAAIIEAAVELVWNEGLEAVTVRGVAAHLGWSQGHVHHQFEALDDLRAEAFTAVWEKLVPMYVFDATSPFSDKLVAVLLGNADAAVTPIADRIWRDALTAARMHPQVRTVLQTAMRQWLQGVEDVLKAGRGTGDIPPELDIARVARRLISAAIGQDIIGSVLDQNNSLSSRADLVRDALRIEIAASAVL